MREIEPTIDPGLYQNRKANPHEIVYELTADRKVMGFGIAIADIEQSVAHSHRSTIETYTVVQGVLELRLDDTRRVLEVGDIARIDLGVVHSARSIGDGAARITVTTIPEFSADDYFLETTD